MERSEIPALTGLRGVAACLVTLYHFWPSEQLADGPLKNTVGFGVLGLLLILFAADAHDLAIVFLFSTIALSIGPPART